MANRINYQVGFDINKSGLNQLKSSLQQLSRMKFSDLMKINESDMASAQTALRNIKTQVTNVEAALKQAFNVKLDTVNIESFNKALKDNNTSIEKIYSTFKQAGVAGENAFRSLSSQVLNTNVQLKESHTLLDNMATTLANTVKWNVASSAVNQLSQSVQEAWGYIKSLDTSLNDIRIVTNKTAEDMDIFAQKANKAAQSLGTTTTDYTKASLIFAQQGLSDKEIQERAKVTLKTANVTGQSTDEVSEQLTSVWNGYKVSAEQAELYVDRLAAVAAGTASDLEELATGMSKVASAANIMGVGQDQLAAQISTIISATREAPETVGMALKTIYARINDIKAGISDDGATLGRFSGQLADYGVNILDAQGHLRDMGDVIEEIGGKWGDLTRQQQVSLAQIAGGKYQYARFLSLFDNWDQYVKTLETARNAEGALQQQQDIYMESTAAHLNQLKAAKQNIFDSFADTDTINGLVDGLTTVANTVASFVDSVGGGGQILKDLGAIGVTVFSNQIAKGINTTITNFEIAKKNAEQFRQGLAETQKWKGIPGLDQLSKQLIETRQNAYQLAKSMSSQQFDELQKTINETTKATNEYNIALEKAQKAESAFGDTLKGQVSKTRQAQEQATKNVDEQIQKYQELSKVVQDTKMNFNIQTDNDFKLIKEYINQYISQLEQLDIQNGNIDQHRQKIEELRQSLSQLPKSADNVKQVFDAVEDAIDESTGVIEGKVTQLRDAYKQVNDAEDKAAQGSQKAAGIINNAFRTLQVENIAKIAGGIAQVGMSIEQIQNLGSIWKNSDLSTGQKILQTVTNLAMTLPMLVSGFTTITGALGLLTVQTGAAGAAAIQAGTAFQLFGAAITASPLLPFIAAAGALVGVLAIVNSSLKQQREQLIKQQEAIIETQNKTQDQIKSHEELYTSLEQLNEKYKEGQISRSELKNGVQDLIGQYGLEGEAADKLRDSYLDLTGAIKEAREEQEKELINSTKREENAAKRAFREGLKGEGGLLNQLFADYSKYTIGAGGTTKDVQDQISKVFKSNGAKVSDNGVITYDINFTTASSQELIDFYEDIQNAVDELEKSSKISQEDLSKATQYQRATEFLKEYTDQYNALKESVEDTNEAVNNSRINSIVKNVDLQNIKDENDYLEKRTEIINKLKDSYRMTYEEAANVVDDFLAKNHQELFTQFNDIADGLDKFKEKIGSEIPQQVENLIGKLNDQQLAALLGIDPENVKNWQQFSDILTQISEKDFSNLEAIHTSVQDLQQSAAEDFTYFQSLEDQVSSGKSISSSEYQKLAEQGAEQLQQFFTMTANGTYKMTQDAETFYETVNHFKLDGFYDTLDLIQQKIDAINNFSVQNFDYSQLNQSAFGAGAVGFDFNTDVFEKQLDYLEQIDGATQGEIENWRLLIKNQELSVQACEEVASKIQEAGDWTQDLDGQTNALKETAIEVYQQIHDAMFPTDEDVDETALGHLSEMLQSIAESSAELDDSLASNARYAEDLAQSILRFDDAIVDVVDHYDEWIQALNSGSLQEQAEAIYELRDAYADMLDLDGSSLSNDFLTNAYNLQLMKAAIDGNIDAYNQLLFLAGQDIAVQVGLDTSWFEEEIDNLLIEYYGIQDLDDIVIGTRLDDQEFLNKLTNLVNAAGMTAQQATDYLASMGMDAEVVEQRAEAEQVQDVIGEKTTMVPVEGITSRTWMDGDRPKVFEHIDQQASFISEPVMGTVTGKKESAAFTLKVTAAGKTSGGHFKYSQSNHGGGSAGNARRSNNSSNSGGSSSSSSSAANREAERAARQAENAAKKAARQQQQAERKAQREAEQAAKKAQQEQEKAQKEAEQAAKKAQQQAQKAQQEWQKENSDYRTKDQKKQVKDEADLYHDINIEIKAIDRQLDRVSKKQDRMYGKDLLANLNKQTQILERHKQKLKEKQQIQEYDLKLHRKQLEAMGASFDMYGNISNYMSVVASKQSIINDLITQYNVLINNYNSSSNKTYKDNLEKQMEQLDKRIKNAQEDLKEFQSTLKDYDSIRDDWEDIVDQIEEQTQKQIEINIKKFRMQLEIRLDMGEAARDWNEFQRKVLNHTDIIKQSDFIKTFKDATQSQQDALSYFGINGKKGEIEKLTQQLYNTLDQINVIDSLGWSDVYGDNKQQAMQDLISDVSKLEDALIDVNEKIDQIDQAYLDTIEDAQKHFDEQINDYQFVQGLLEHDMDLLELLYGDKNYAVMDKYYSQLIANHKQQLDFYNKEAEFWKKQWENADGEKDAEIFKQNYMNAVNSIREEIAKAAQDLKDQFSNSINSIFDDLEKKITNGKGLDYVEMEWQLINKNANEYLDTINTAFAVQELENKFRKALNDTNKNNLKAQRAIKNLMDEQLENLKSKEKLTQYDVDRAEKLLEIEQARAALEDARSSKTSMRLKRDSQGNYSYEYVADQDSIIEAQQRLATAQNDLYNFDKDRYKSNLEDMLNAYKDFKSKQAELELKALEGNEEAQRQLVLLREQYGEYINDKTEQNLNIRTNLTQSAFDQLAAIYGVDVENYQSMAEAERNTLINDLIPYWDSGIQQMSDKISGSGGFIPTLQDSFDKMAEATKNYENQLDDLAKTAGFDLNDVREGVDLVSDSFKELIEDNEELIEVMEAEIGVLGDLKVQAHALASEYNAVYESAKRACSSVYDMIQAQNVQAAAEAAQYSTGDYSSNYSTGSSSNSSNSSNYSSGSSGNDNDYYDSGWYGDIPHVGDAVTFDGQYYHDSWGRTPAGSYYSGVQDGVIIDEQSSYAYGGVHGNGTTGEYDIHIKSADGVYRDLGWIRLSQVRGFASGGYTGDWFGNEGKIGILHQKEMVLNQEDTKNILNTVSIIRSVMGDLKGSIFTKLNGLNSSIYNPNVTSDSLEQNVHIDATFPNVDSKREIEEAFNDLVNLAAQRALR